MTFAGADDAPWRRLSIRVIWIDVAVSVLALMPGAIAVIAFDVGPSLRELWPLATVAAWGLVSAVGDAIRWACTSYRITSTDIERRTGLFVRTSRTMHRDRVRSVDTSAKLRHRWAGLRVVTVGAGQQTGVGESALVLDALSKTDAAALQELLLDAPTAHQSREDEAPAAERVAILASFDPRWVVYNMFSVWAYLMAAGLLWGAFWLLSSLGIDLFGFVAELVDWDSLGWLRATAIALAGGGVIGAIGLGVNFLLGYGNFVLARVHTHSGSYLRTRRGVLSTREVNRDESRMRGMSIGEPLLWRWMGMADTNVITTGLDVWDTEEPTAILPRGPISVARRTVAEVFGSANPLSSPLARHPRAALRRRLWWATALSWVAPFALAVPAVTGAVAAWVPWAALAVWPVALTGAFIAYRALGHGVSGDHLVVRSGLFSRTTSALRRDAVSTIAIRQSILQRRLGLCTVSAMTAAGWSACEAPDISSRGAVAFAAQAAPGQLDYFVDGEAARDRG
ncbi:MAG: PH domain-containing protein [Microbacterium gubbeenense]